MDSSLAYLRTHLDLEIERTIMDKVMAANNDRLILNEQQSGQAASVTLKC